MSSTERKTIDIPSTKDQPATTPVYYIDDRSKTALRELEEGDLLQVAVDHAEGEIGFAELNQNIAPESLAKYFEAPAPTKFAFYVYPRSGNVLLIWTRFSAVSSAKKIRAQNRVRRDLIWHAEKEGINAVDTLQISSQKDMTSERLQQASGSSAVPKQP
ncbi:hypothetical protein NW762_004613 [Fusarium torreyae]|uniref:ADF-H domain-containing protein n=1 Tax=Fusarium torreyae TaxID=1237075 RepID=A0A9W8S6Z7_9HYPO|nr:hypothetical protein NW762_004613 [Fusarium torreyae]